MELVYDGPHFLAVDKPAGWLSVPGRGGADDVRPVLGRVLEQELGARLWPVHRLDAEVSGLVLYARDPEAHRAANQWFESHQVHKRYEALSEPGDGPPPVGIQEWRSKLLRGKKRAYDSPHGKVALTRAEVVGRRGLLWHWHLWPLTGRPHQLRVHVAQHAGPIAGDTLYGARTPWPSGIALRAVELDLSACDGHKTFGLPEQLHLPGISGTQYELPA